MMPLDRATVLHYAGRYDEHYLSKQLSIVETRMKALLQHQRFLTRDELIEIGMWKSHRPQQHYAKNDDLTVREITQFSLATTSERARMLSLHVLEGVGYPLASVILHFAFPDKYGILDVRAVDSLG